MTTRLLADHPWRGWATVAPILSWLPTRLPAFNGFALSSALGELFKPGDTIDASLYSFVNLLRNCYDAAACVIVMHTNGAPRLYMSGGGTARPPRGTPLDALLAEALSPLGADLAVLHWRPRLSGGGPVCQFFDSTTLKSRRAEAGAVAGLVELLEAASFMSVPLRSRSQALGRLHLVSTGRRYWYGDLRTLVQLARQAGPCIESALLVERLSQMAARQERRRISRDLHDGTIQPYIGLKLGLEALRRKLSQVDGAAHEIDELIAMAGDGITQLRHYVGRLKSTPQASESGPLLPAVREQADKMGRYYGLQTQVLAHADVRVTARLQDEVLHMIREALSNVRRHTCGRCVTISVHASARQLLMEVVNDHPGIAGIVRDFYPHSIGERAEDLGGQVRVEQRNGCHTALVIELPL